MAFVSRKRRQSLTTDGSGVGCVERVLGHLVGWRNTDQQLGCRQVVRHGVLISAYPGSNPGIPANYFFRFAVQELSSG